MNKWHKELLDSAVLDTILDDVEFNQPLDFVEYQTLQDTANAKLDGLIRRHQGLHDLETLRQASQTMARLLQTTCLALRQAKLGAEERRQAREALEYQLAYQQACLRRSLVLFSG